MLRRWFWKVLRFANVLEPGRHVVSLTKLMVWEIIVGGPFLVLYMVRSAPDTVGGMIGAVTAAVVPALPVLLAYAHRRHVQGGAPQPRAENPESM